jgi:hypothetical protein
MARALVAHCDTGGVRRTSRHDLTTADVVRMQRVHGVESLSLVLVVHNGSVRAFAVAVGPDLCYSASAPPKDARDLSSSCQQVDKSGAAPAPVANTIACVAEFLGRV